MNPQRDRVRTGIVGLLILAAAAASGVVHAGNGTFRNGKANFCVSVRFNATAAQIDRIRARFQNASQILADATDDQAHFGTVTIVNDSGAGQSAEYWINSGDSGAYATQGKFGVQGEHINLYYDRYFTSDDATLSRENAYSLAHEFAHHAWGVLDEYSGPSGAAECAPTPDTTTLSYCFMDNFKVRGGRSGGGTTHTLNEFCVSSNHDPDGDTFQESIHHESCWETISSHPTRALTAPTGLPTDPAPAAHTVTLETGSAGLRVVLLTDRSDSMNDFDRLTFAKSSAGTFIDFLGDGDSVGTASFECTSTSDYPLTTITAGSTVKADAKAAINALSAAGATNIGGGLLTALGQITGQATHSCNEVIVLLSDGDHNCGTDPATVLSQIQDRGATIYSVGVGPDISVAGQATLQNLATQTGGRYDRVANASDLTSLFTQLSMQTTGSGLLTRDPETLNSNQVLEIPVPLEAGVLSAHFVVTLADSADTVTLSLRTPSGVVIDQGSVVPPDEFLSDPHLRAFKIGHPEAGSWTMVLSAGAIVTGSVEAMAFAHHDGVSLNASTKAHTLSYPSPIVVDATPTFDGKSVVGASVEGVVTRPDGCSLSIPLFDDGLAAHADAVAGDGAYAAKFDRYGGSGTYSFELKGVNADGVAYVGEENEREPGDAPIPVPAFTRMGITTAVVSSVPPIICPAPITLECGTAGGVSRSDAAIQAWLAGVSATGACTPSAVANDAPPLFPAGCGPDGISTVVTFTGPTGAACTSSVTARDTTAPVIAVQPTIAGGHGFLWTPEHGYVDFSIADTGIVASDVCDGVSFEFSSCVSSQPEDAAGLGDGRSLRDCVMDGTTLHLRAERDGGCPNGRTYTMTVDAIDNCGNRSRSAPFTVAVPHDLAGQAPGTQYSANPGSNQNSVRPGVNGTYGSGCSGPRPLKSQVLRPPL